MADHIKDTSTALDYAARQAANFASAVLKRGEAGAHDLVDIQLDGAGTDANAVPLELVNTAIRALEAATAAYSALTARSDSGM